MTTETIRPQTDDQTQQASEQHTSDLKASDFFPPGTGWNKNDGPQKGPSGNTDSQDPADRDAGRSQH